MVRLLGPGLQILQSIRPTNATMKVLLPEREVVATGGRFVKNVWVLLIILARLCGLTRWAVLARRQGLVSVHKKSP